MDAEVAVELGREALMLALIVGAPLLLAAVVTGLVVGLVQAMVHVQEQAISFVPKLVIMLAVFVISMPWLLEQLTQYTHELIVRIPETL